MNGGRRLRWPSAQRVIRAASGGLIWAFPALFLFAFLAYPLLLLIFVVATTPGPLTPPSLPEAAASALSLREGVRQLARTLADILGDPYFRSLLRFTTGQAILSTLLSALIGLPVAALLSNYSFRGRSVLYSLTLVPFVLPPISVALGFILVYGNNGWLNRLLGDAFGFRLQILYALPGILLAHAFYNAPVFVRTVTAAWMAIDASQEEAARTLGASPWRVFWTITVPGLAPGLATGAALAFVFSFLSFPLVLALGGARFATVEVEIYTQLRVLLNYRTGAGLALLEALISLAFSYGYLWLEGRFARPQLNTRPHALRRPTRPRRGGGWAGLAAGLLALVGIALFYLAPLAALVVGSLRAPGVADFGPAPGINLESYRYVFTPQYEAILGDSPLASVRNSLLLATATTGVSLLVGTPLAYLFAGRLQGGRAPAQSAPWARLTARLTQIAVKASETLAMAPLAISSVALGYALLEAFSRPPLAGLRAAPALAIVAAHSVLAYPFVIRTLRPALEAIGPELPESARLLGATRWQAFRTVELPLAANSFLSGALLSFAMSLAETSATILLAGPGLSTMPITLYHLLSARNFGGASAMAVVMLAVTAASFILVEAIGRRNLRSPAGHSRTL